MRHLFKLISTELEDVVLRTAEEKDCENLRQWKNSNRFLFFYQDLITPESQKKWFKGYLEREKDFMFLVLHKEQAVGCLGFRMLGDQADIYNVILGCSEMARKGIMSQAMRLMCSYIDSEFTREIGLKVLRSNPAVEWYKKNAFEETVRHDTYLKLRLNVSQFQPCGFQKVDS